MTLEEAIKESIRKYYEMEDDTDLEVYKSTDSEHMYTKKYFDKFEEEILDGRTFKSRK